MIRIAAVHHLLQRLRPKGRPCGNASGSKNPEKLWKTPIIQQTLRNRGQKKPEKEAGTEDASLVKTCSLYELHCMFHFLFRLLSSDRLSERLSPPFVFRFMRSRSYAFDNGFPFWGEAHAFLLASQTLERAEDVLHLVAADAVQRGRKPRPALGQQLAPLVGFHLCTGGSNPAASANGLMSLAVQVNFSTRSEIQFSSDCRLSHGQGWRSVGREDRQLVDDEEVEV